MAQDDPCFQVHSTLSIQLVLSKSNSITNLLGMQVHALATLAGAGIGRTLDNWRNDYLAEKDAVLRHYIELHPDDFPAPGKYSQFH